MSTEPRVVRGRVKSARVSQSHNQCRLQMVLGLTIIFPAVATLTKQ